MPTRRLPTVFLTPPEEVMLEEPPLADRLPERLTEQPQNSAPMKMASAIKQQKPRFFIGSQVLLRLADTLLAEYAYFTINRAKVKHKLGKEKGRTKAFRSPFS